MSNKPTMENNSTGNANVFPPQKVKIIEARSVSGEDIYKNGKPVDVGIEFTLDIGKDFYPKYSITGNFKLAPDGQNWLPSTTTRVTIALQRLGIKWKSLNPDNSIPDEILQQCIGKEILILKYCSKVREEDQKPMYNTFGEFFLASVDGAREKLLAKFNESVSKGYTKVFDLQNYHAPKVETGDGEAPVPFADQF